MVALAALQEVLRKVQGVALVEVALEEVALAALVLVEVALAKVDRMQITARAEQMLQQKLQ